MLMLQAKRHVLRNISSAKTAHQVPHLTPKIPLPHLQILPSNPQNSLSSPPKSPRLPTPLFPSISQKDSIFSHHTSLQHKIRYTILSQKIVYLIQYDSISYFRKVPTFSAKSPYCFFSVFLLTGTSVISPWMKILDISSLQFVNT